MVNEEQRDTDRLHLSERNQMFLKQLQSEGLIDTMIDGYRLAFAVAVYKSLDHEQHQFESKQTQGLNQQIDPDQVLKETVKTLYPSSAGKEYTVVEKLADLGVELLSSRLDGASVIDPSVLMQ